MAEICEACDNFIREETGKLFPRQKTIMKGLAFPTCLSINNIVSHFSPFEDDETILRTGDVVKMYVLHTPQQHHTIPFASAPLVSPAPFWGMAPSFPVVCFPSNCQSCEFPHSHTTCVIFAGRAHSDLGVQVDKFPALAATTTVVGFEQERVTGRKADLLAATEAVAKAAARLVRVGNKVNEDLPFSPDSHFVSHQMSSPAPLLSPTHFLAVRGGEGCDELVEDSSIDPSLCVCVCVSLSLSPAFFWLRRALILDLS